MKNKIALILGTNIHWAPFYYRYENVLMEENVEFDLIIWNRENIIEKSKAQTIYEYKKRDVSNNKSPLKITKFFGFSKFVKKMLKNNRYDKVIFVGTYGCASAFCFNYLEKEYKNKVWIDIRDDLYEWFKPYYIAQEKSIKASYVTTISSHKYKVFLPEFNYNIMHNIDPQAIELKKKFKRKKDSAIRISFIGNVRYYEQNKKILELFKNDERFKIQYFGAGSEPLKEYCDNNIITNVEFYGRFSQDETINFYEKTDIINNVYGNDTLNLQTALSNKLYYGLLLNLPILVSPNTYMEDLSLKYDIGFSFREKENIADDLYNWYVKIKDKEIIPKFDLLWKKFFEEDRETIMKLKKFIKEEC